MKRLMLALVLVLAGCGGGEGEPDTATEAADPTTAEEQSAPQGTQTPTDTEVPSDESSAAGAGSVIATIGDETWEFDIALCTNIDGTPGDAGSVWRVSNNDSSFQVLLNADPPNNDHIAVGGGPFAEDETNNWESLTPHLEVHGSTVIGSGTFINRFNDETAQGTVTAICPDWGDDG